MTGSVGATVPASATPGGFKAEYFNNKELQGQPVVVRTDEQINFDWSRGRPAPEINEDGFSARWTGKFTPPESGEYQLGAMADDGEAKRFADNFTIPYGSLGDGRPDFRI